MSHVSDTKRVVKNTGLLYFRLLLLTAINLYTVRITLQVLGVVDYGIYNAIASLVASMSVLNGAMTSATQRFLSYHLGKEDANAYSRTYSLLLIGFGILSIAIVLIGEPLGTIFVDDILKIPATRLYAAKWVFQTALLSFVCNLMVIPFASSIVANERMDAFALFGIIDGLLKLGVVCLLLIDNGDHLILYGVLLLVESLIVLLLHIIYCKIKFKYCRISWIWDKALFKELTGYTGWNLFGSISGMLTTQGQNILLNIFFGPVINAAKGIGDRIMNVVQGFSTNLYMAVSPQIIKTYAAGDLERCHTLVLKSSRLAFMLLFVIGFPLICNMKGVLGIWLGPDSRSEDMVAFATLMLTYCMVGCLEQPVTRIIQATGKIKRYQLTVGSFTILYIPIMYLVFYLGGDPFLSVVILIVMMILAMGLRVFVAHNQVSLSYRGYFKEVVIPVARVTVIGLIGYMIAIRFLQPLSFVRVLIGVTICGIFGVLAVWVAGLQRSDRDYIYSLLRNKILHH